MSRLSPSPASRESRSNLLSQLSAMSRDRSRHQSASPTHNNRDHTQQSINNFATQSSFDIAEDEEVISSTQQFENEVARELPNLRTTAKKMGYYNPPPPQLPVPSSALRGAFNDFTSQNMGSDDDSDSVEIGRGAKRSSRNTPSRLPGSNDASPNVMFRTENDSLYELTATPGSNFNKKANEVERGSLRREASLRRASSAPLKEVESLMARLGKKSSPGKENTQRPKSTLAQMHARVISEDEGEGSDERPPTVHLTARNTRFAGLNARHASAGPSTQRPTSTPQRVTAASARTPRSAPGNMTQNSFALPDLPNLTELVSGAYSDGTPIFSRSAKARSRFTAVPRPTNHLPIESLPVPADEKAIFASLQLLKERLVQVEQEKADAERKVEDQEMEIIDLRAQVSTSEKMKRSDSGLGSTDEEGKKQNWKIEKTKLETSVETLRSRLDRAERKVSTSDIATKRITEERDNLVTQLGVAFYNSEELKQENESLKQENDTLRHEVDALRSENALVRTENEQLRLERVQIQAEYEGETQQLQQRLDRKSTTVERENETLHKELARVRAQREEDTHNFARRKTDLRSKTLRQQRAEHAKLQAENDALKSQLAQAEAQHAENARRAAMKEAELRTKVDIRDETIRHFQDTTQQSVNDTLQHENEELRVRLARLSTTHDEETEQWGRKESKLRSRIERREQELKETQRLAKELARAHPTESDARISAQVEQEIRKSRKTSSAQQPAGRIPFKLTQSKAQSLRTAAASKTPRSASAPLPQDVENHTSDAESTTDLDVIRQASYIAEAGTPHPARFYKDQHDEDLTYLSVMAEEEVAQLRKMLEEERRTARQRKTNATTHAAHANEHTGRSVYSTMSAPKVMPRKSSLKDITSRPEANDESMIDVTQDQPAEAQDATGRSALSNTSRRRRSAPIEMTSAFILPDITLHKRRSLHADMNALHPEGSENCTVCRRASCNDDHTNTGKDEEPLSMPTPIPVSQRMPDDVDATMRPTQPPSSALAMVLKELQDELSHIKLEHASKTARLNAHDPSLGMRVRKALSHRLEQIRKAMDIKSDQIYALYDVLEGFRISGEDSVQQDGAAETVEQQIEETLQSIGMDEHEARERAAKGTKRVVIEDDETEDLPWEGLSETESLAGGTRRSGFY